MKASDTERDGVGDREGERGREREREGGNLDKQSDRHIETVEIGMRNRPIKSDRVANRQAERKRKMETF